MIFNVLALGFTNVPFVEVNCSKRVIIKIKSVSLVTLITFQYYYSLHNTLNHMRADTRSKGENTDLDIRVHGNADNVSGLIDRWKCCYFSRHGNILWKCVDLFFQCHSGGTVLMLFYGTSNPIILWYWLLIFWMSEFFDLQYGIIVQYIFLDLANKFLYCCFTPLLYIAV